MFYLTGRFVLRQIEVVVLRVLLPVVAGLGFCTPWWTDQRQLGVFSEFFGVQAFRF